MTNDGVSLAEGAALLVKMILAEPDPEKQVALTLTCFRDVQKVAIYEAATVLSLGGKEALYRLFAHHGVKT